MKKGRFQAITSGVNHNIQWFNIDRKRQRVLLSINKNGYTETAVISALNYKKMKVPFERRDGFVHVSFGSTTRDGRFTLFHLSPYNAPSSSYVYDWQTQST